MVVVVLFMFLVSSVIFNTDDTSCIMNGTSIISKKRSSLVKFIFGKKEVWCFALRKP